MARECSDKTCLLKAREPSPKLAAVIDATDPGAWMSVGGIPLVARTLFHMQALVLKKVLVLLDREKPCSDLTQWQKDLTVTYAQMRGSLPETILSVSEFHEPFLWVDAVHLIDPRLLKALASACETTIAYMDPSDRTRPRLRAGYLTAEDLNRWAEPGPWPLFRSAAALFPGDLDPFDPAIRGNLPPYFLEVRSEEAAKKATRMVIESQQKKVMDLPAEYIHPPFENTLTRFLVDTPVSPNMVTLIGAAAGIGVACLFWHGYLISGGIGTFIVDILDGVDGKLARTKLHFSRFGRHEALIDYFVENSWYVALAVGLGAAAPASHLPAFIATLMVVSDTADNIFNTLALKRFGKPIDLFGPFDAGFRRIAGRRNIYGFIFLIGFLMGFPLTTFAASAVWAAVTAGIHGFRLSQFRRRCKSSPGYPIK